MCHSHMAALSSVSYSTCRMNTLRSPIEVEILMKPTTQQIPQPTSAHRLQYHLSFDLDTRESLMPFQTLMKRYITALHNCTSEMQETFPKQYIPISHPKPILNQTPS